jgi:hypothetical protein
LVYTDPDQSEEATPKQKVHAMRRVLPAITLFFVAPLVAEFLLGDLPLKLLGALIILAPMYGGGALLVRELVRRSGRGWPSILMLAFAYAVIEEAFTTQTLFNPDYLHLHLGLLKPAYIPALGMGAWWTVFVLTLHTVWSISVSIGLTEALFPDRATTPWLRKLGLTVTAILFILGATASTLLEIKQDHYISTIGQFSGAAVVCVIAIVVAFRMPKTSSIHKPGWVPSPWLVGIIALAAGSIFMVVPNVWGWKAVGIYLIMDLLLIVAVSLCSHRTGWNGLHRLALAGGAALAYAWHAFIQTPVVKGSLDHRVGNAIFALALLIVLVIAARRTAALVPQ